MYRKADSRERLKKKAADGKDQFGSANAATLTGGRTVGRGGARPAGGGTPTELLEDAEGGTENEPVCLEDLDGYFDNLAAAAKTQQTVLEELVQTISTLGKTNAELVDKIKKLEEQLERRGNNQRKRGDGGGRGRGGDRKGGGDQPRKPCAHCKGDHRNTDCWELPSNAGNRPAGWVSKL